MRRGRLGWKNPFRGRPNESFQDLEGKLVIPHIVLEAADPGDSGQTLSGGSWTVIQLSSVEDDYSMLHGDEIIVPDDHDHWWAIGVATLRDHDVFTTGTGQRTLAWYLDGGVLTPTRSGTWSDGGASALVDTQSVLEWTVEAGEALDIRSIAPEDRYITSFDATVRFWPLT